MFPKKEQLSSLSQTKRERKEASDAVKNEAKKEETRVETGTRKSELNGVRKHFMSIAFERGKTSTMGHSRGEGESEGESWSPRV